MIIAKIGTTFSLLHSEISYIVLQLQEWFSDT
jgi:hypothetical protein